MQLKNILGEYKKYGFKTFSSMKYTVQMNKNMGKLGLQFVRTDYWKNFHYIQQPLFRN
jgi:hypothetical protein